jgi:hypothetical protein
MQDDTQPDTIDTTMQTIGTAARSGAMHQAEKQAVKQGEKAAARLAAKEAAKQAAKRVALRSVGKSLLKKIPLLGALAGAAFAVPRLRRGDYLGATGELGSGIASVFPGAGTAASLGIDALLAGRDIRQALQTAKMQENVAQRMICIHRALMQNGINEAQDDSNLTPAQRARIERVRSLNIAHRERQRLRGQQLATQGQPERRERATTDPLSPHYSAALANLKRTLHK